MIFDITVSGSISGKGSKGMQISMAAGANDYEDLALDYSHPEPLDYSFPALTQTKIRESLLTDYKEDELYHEVGPDTGPRQAPPLPVRDPPNKNRRSTNFVKESTDDSADVYEEPLPPSTHMVFLIKFY